MRVPPARYVVSVAQTFLSAVSRAFQPADRSNAQRRVIQSARTADRNVGDTADWKVCATTLPCQASRQRTVLCLSVLLVLFCLAGCRSAPAPLPAINLSEPGWKLREGQALWRSAKDAPEIAGEVTLALHADGRSWVRFTKTPLPFLNAEITKEGWRIEFIPERRVFSGTGVPPARLLWLHLARALNGLAPPAPLRFEKSADGGGRLENRSTGETLTLYL